MNFDGELRAGVGGVREPSYYAETAIAQQRFVELLLADNRRLRARVRELEQRLHDGAFWGRT